MQKLDDVQKRNTGSLMQAMSGLFVSGYQELMYTISSGAKPVNKSHATGTVTSPYCIDYALDKWENTIIAQRKT